MPGLAESARRYAAAALLLSLPHTKSAEVICRSQRVGALRLLLTEMRSPASPPAKTSALVGATQVIRKECEVCGRCFTRPSPAPR